MSADSGSSNDAVPVETAPSASSRWVDVAVAVVFRRRGGAVELLIARRHAEAIRGGLWEFPGGKVEPGELPAEAALREVEEEVGVASDVVLAPPEPLVEVEHADPEMVREKCIRLHAMLVEVRADATASALGSSEIRWVGVDDLDRFEWPKANAAIISAIRARHSRPS